MIVYTIKRFILTLFILAAALVIGFLLINLTPVNPLYIVVANFYQLSLEDQNKISEEYNINNNSSLIYRFGIWFSNIIKGKWGKSFLTGESNTKLVKMYIIRTLSIFLYSIIISFLIGVPLGLALGIGDKREKRYKKIMQLLFFISSIPSIIFSFILIFILSVKLKLFPIAGFSSIAFSYRGFFASSIDIIWHLTLPSLIVAVADGNIGEIVRHASASIINIKKHGFMDFAVNTGISKNVIMYKYMLKTSFISTFSTLRNKIPMIFGGIVVVESIFSINGMGHLLVKSVEINDYFLLSVIIFLISALTALISFINDVLLALLNPMVLKK